MEQNLIEKALLLFPRRSENAGLPFMARHWM